MKSRTLMMNVVPQAILAFASLLWVTSAHADGRFVVSSDGQEVTDTQTKLVWQRCATGLKWDGKTCAGKPSKLTFSNAREIGASTTPTWRIPAKTELLSLVDKSQKKLKIDAQTFPGTPGGLFWAERPEVTDNLNHWMVDFRNGRVVGNVRNAKYFVRFVRVAG